MSTPAAGKAIKGLPNILTVSRILVIPVLVALMSFPGPETRALATLLFVLAGITDIFDGYLARRYNVTSSMGKLLDPMADKLLIMAALVMLLACPESAVPAWMVVILLSREIMITSLRGVAAARGVVIQAEQIGKYKAVIQVYAVTGLLMHYTYFHIDFHAGGLYFLWISVILSLWSGYTYLRRFWGVVTE